MAKDNQSLVTLTPPTWNQTVSWTSAATSRGTKKIRRMVSAFGRFIAQTNYIKSVTGGCLTVLGPFWGTRRRRGIVPGKPGTDMNSRRSLPGIHVSPRSGVSTFSTRSVLIPLLQQVNHRPHFTSVYIEFY